MPLTLFFSTDCSQVSSDITSDLQGHRLRAQEAQADVTQHLSQALDLAIQIDRSHDNSLAASVALDQQNQVSLKHQMYLCFFEIAFERLLDPTHNVNGLLAIKDNEPVGLVHYIFHEHMWRPEGVCYLQDLFTAPQARGTGAGRALINAVYKAADDAGAPRVYWLTQEFNTTARHLYDKVAKLSPFIKYDRP